MVWCVGQAGLLTIDNTRRFSLQLIPVPDPLPVGVVKPVAQPLGLQQLVALSVEEQWLSSPEKGEDEKNVQNNLFMKILLQFSIFFPESVQINGSPDAGSFTTDHHNGGGVDRKEGSGAGPTVHTVPHCLMHHVPGAGAAACLPQAYHHPAQQA